MRRLRRALPIVVIASALALPAWAAEESASAELDLARSLIESADTSAQHELLAKYYEALANEQRMSALSHRTMGESYLRAKHRKAEEQQKHCDEIAALEERISQVYERMATIHAESAKP